MKEWTKKPDGMFIRETRMVTPKDRRDDPEFRAELERNNDPYHVLKEMLTECEDKTGKKVGDIWNDFVTRIAAMPDTIKPTNTNIEGDDVKRAHDDLTRLYIETKHCLELMKPRQWKLAIRVAIYVGRLAERAEIRQQIEPEVLTGRDAKKKGGPAAAAARRAKREQHDREDGPTYQKRMLELRLEGIKYGHASDIMQDEFRQKDGAKRHNARRIRELAPNPITKQKPTPPKDYGR